MKNVLIISFDLVRPDEVNQSLSIASLLAYGKSNPGYGIDFQLTHHSVNMFEKDTYASCEAVINSMSHLELHKFDIVAISCYVWSEYLINSLIIGLRKRGFNKAILLGGYQISYSTKDLLKYEYPDCQFFVSGYGEQALIDAIYTNATSNMPLFFSENIDFTAIPSVYTNGEIQISYNQPMVRMETKRGCPYRCSFCAHRDLKNNKIYKRSEDKIFAELDLFRAKEVQKINVLDPVFNVGKEYLGILEEAKRIGFKGMLSLQSKIELILNHDGGQFLDYCSELNVCLEFGVQTIHENEYKVIKRHNSIEKIEKVMRLLNERNINYEMSIIYGLPNQTVESFQQTINFLQKNGCQNLAAYPLMLLKGTELFAEKEKWNFREKITDDFNIPVVVSSNSFNESDWLLMQNIAGGLMANKRF